MILRDLVHRLLREAAGRKVFEEVAKATGRRSDPSQSGTAQERADCEVAFVFALGVESGGLVDLLQNLVTTRCASFSEHAGLLNDRPVVVIETGVGGDQAARATEDLIVIHKPAWVISAGFAGALTHELRRGHILMADHVVDCHTNQLAVGFKMDPHVIKSTKGLHVGRLLTVDRLIRTTDEKRMLGEQHDALACDMETMAVANVCRRQGVRFLSVRIISDGLDDQLPPEVETLLDQKSLAAKMGAATGAIFQRPSIVKDLWKFKEEALKASDRLAKFLVGVVPQLTAPTE